MSNMIWIWTLLLFFSEILAGQNDEKLLSVIVLYRHGARTPVKLYKNDPYGAVFQKYWPEGFGELNDEGVQQQLILGKWLRTRYNNFIRPKYHKEDIFVRSSNIDRCLMSATSNLAGLYALPTDNSTRISKTWMPVPIHTKPELEDAVLVGGKPCPKYKRLYDDLMKTETFVNLFEASKGLFNYLSKYSGEAVVDFMRMMLIYDSLNVESSYNLTLPEWTKEVYPAALEQLVALYWTSQTYTKEMARLRIGPLIEMITKHFEDISNGKPNTPKMLMLSAHDSTLANLMNSLGIYDMKQPKYASALILEMRQGADAKYVNIFYKNDTYADEAHMKQLFGSEKDCCLQEFMAFMAPLRIDENIWEEECLDLREKS